MIIIVFVLTLSTGFIHSQAGKLGKEFVKRSSEKVIAWNFLVVLESLQRTIILPRATHTCNSLELNSSESNMIVNLNLIC